MKPNVTTASSIMAALAVITLNLAATAYAAETGHLTLRLEDGIKDTSFTKAPVPLIIAVPVTDGVGGAGVAVASYASPLPFPVDGSGLRVGPAGVTGTVTVVVKFNALRKDEAKDVSLTWTVQAKRSGDEIVGTATCDTRPEKYSPVVAQSGLVGFWDPVAERRGWMLELGLPWVGEATPAYVETVMNVQLRFPAQGDPQVAAVGFGALEAAFGVVQSSSLKGTADSFTGEIEIARPAGGPAALRAGTVKLVVAGRRVGRSGLVKVIATEGAGRFESESVAVFAWPDHAGYRLGPLKPEPPAPLSAEPDAALVQAALEESLRPIFPKSPGTELVWPGTSSVWSTMLLARRSLVGVAVPVFDIKVLPHAAKYKATVERNRGQPKLVAEATGTDPWELLNELWLKTDIGYYRFSLYGDTPQPLWQMNVVLGRGDLQKGKDLNPKDVPHNVGPLPDWLVPLPEAPRYKVQVTQKDKSKIVGETKTPWNPLAELWTKIPVGENVVTIRSLDADGKELGPRPWSTKLTKRPAFQGPYSSGPARPYQQVLLDLGRWICDHPSGADFRAVTYEAPYGGGDYEGNQRSAAAVAGGVMRYRFATDPAEKSHGLWIARNGGDHLLAVMRNVGRPCTYKNYTTLGYTYGTAFLLLHEVTGEERWRQAAEAVAEDFVKRQKPEGNFWLYDGPPVAKIPEQDWIIRADLAPGIHGPQMYEMDPSDVLWFLGKLRTQLKTDKYRECEEKAYQWVMQNPVKSGIWMDAGAHSTCPVVPLNLTGRNCSYFALYLLDSAPPERRDLKLVDELMRYAENQHMDWSREGRDRIQPNLNSAVPRECGAAIWQGARYAEVWIKLYRQTKNPLHLAKAKAMAEAITRAQNDGNGSLDLAMQLQAGSVGGDSLTRFRLNWGECAVHLRNYADTLEKP